MPDVTYKRIDEMDAIYDGIARRARAELGVSSFGMQIMSLPPRWDGYPDHDHGQAASDPGQEEVYIPLQGDGTLVADGHEYSLRPGVAVRVGPEQSRRILPGDQGLRFLALVMRVWADVDIAGLTALLSRDAVLTMPPEDVRVDGAEAIAGFFATVPAGGRLDDIRLHPTRANGQPALAAYLRERDTGEHRAYGIMVLTVEGDRISAITGFPGPEVFTLFNLRDTLPPAA